jgi:hypothetical protein
MGARRSVIVTICLAGLAAAAIAALYLQAYIRHRWTVPLGWDTPSYVWRTHIARATGLFSLPPEIPSPGPSNAGRPGFTAIAGVLASFTGGGLYRLTETLPALMAAAAGLGSGTFVSAGLKRPAWMGLLVGLGVGTSVFFVHVINVEQYQDGAIAAAIFTAGALAVVIALRDRRAVIAGTLLLGALGVVHWSFYEIGLGIVALVGLIYLPGSFKACRTQGSPWWKTPVASLGVIGLGSAGIVLVMTFWVLGAPLPSPRLVAGQFAFKLGRDLPSYRLSIFIALALIGIWTLTRRSSEQGEEPGAEGTVLLDAGTEHQERSRAFVALCLAWCAAPVVIYLAQEVLHRAVPTHRVLAFTLAIPILAALGLLGIADLGRASWRPVGIGVLTLGLGASIWAGADLWDQFHPVMRADQVAGAGAASGYLEAAGVAEQTPVVFVIDDRGPAAWSRIWLEAHTIRAELAPGRITQAYFYVGTPQDYLAERPSVMASPVRGGTSPQTYAGLSSSFFEGMRQTYDQDPVAIAIGGASAEAPVWASKHPETVIAPGVVVLRGPAPDGASRRAGIEARAEALAEASPGPGQLIPAALIGFLVLTAAGLGWTRALLGRWLQGWELFGLAPAIGAGALVLGAVVLNRAGIALRGPGAIAIVVLVAASGWGAAWLGQRRRRRA